MAPDDTIPADDAPLDGDGSGSSDSSGTSNRSERSDDDGVRRRTLIRLLVGLGIGIPILIELLTLAGLLEQSLFGDDSDDDGSGDDGPADRVGVGDELLPATPQTETITEATLQAREDTWRFTLSVAVANGTGQSYVLQLGAVTTDRGREVRGESPAVRVEPGGSATVSGRWDLPTGATPRTLSVAVSQGDGETTRHEVALARVSVRGQRA